MNRQRIRRTPEERQAMRQEALSRAQNPYGPLTNFVPIITEFAARGIPETDIRPRENVFTFQAWKALGRHVKRGEHGVKVITYVPMSREEQVKNEQTGEVEKKVKTFSRPFTATVFHISQTEPDAQPAQKGA